MSSSRSETLIARFSRVALRVNLDAVLALLLFLASFLLYARTVTPGVLDGDGGEFQTNIYRLGVSHTGYPLYFILAKIWTLILPIGSIAYRANLFSSLFGAITLVLLFFCMRSLVASHAAAVLTALLFGVSRVEWSQALIPDVYTLNSFFIVLIVWLAVLWRIGRISLLWVAFAYGLSLTHHRTMIWFAPALALFILLGEGRALFQPKRILSVIGVFLLPLLLYLYIPLRGDSDVGVEYHAANAVQMIFATNVSISWRFGPPGFIWDRITQVYLPLLIEQFTVFGFALGWLGIISLARGKAPRGFPGALPPRQFLLFIGVAHLVESAFAVFFWVVDSEIFFIPSYLTFLFFIGIGIALALDWLASAPLHLHATTQRLMPIGFSIGVAIICVYLLWTNFSRVDQSGNDEAQSRWQAILAQPLEEGTTIIGPWEDITPLEYYQYVENVRPDINKEKVIVYRDQLKIAPQADIADKIQQLLKKKTSVLMTRHPAETETLTSFVNQYEIVPLVSMWRLQSPAAHLTTSGSIAFGEQLKLSKYGIQDAKAGTFETAALWWDLQDGTPDRFRVQLHLRDSMGEIWAQTDEKLLGELQGPSPTLPEPFYAPQGLYIPPDAPPGDYDLDMTVLDNSSGEALGGDGQGGFLLGKVRVGTPRESPPLDVLRIPHPSDEPIGNAHYLGYGVSDENPRGGDVLDLTTWWQGIQNSDENIEYLLKDVKGVSTSLYQGAMFPEANGEFDPKQILRAHQSLTLPPTVAAGSASIWANRGGQTAKIAELNLRPTDRKFGAPVIEHPQVGLMGDTIQLLGYALPSLLVNRGGDLKLSLFWEANKSTAASLKVFVHLLDANGVLRAQQDSFPRGGTLPTSRWFPGEYIQDDYSLPLGRDLLPGQYQIEVGMYDPDSGARVQTFDANGNRLPNDRMLLDSTILVK